VQIQNPCAPGHATVGGPKYNCLLMQPKIATGAQAQASAAQNSAQTAQAAQTVTASQPPAGPAAQPESGAQTTDQGPPTQQ